MSEKTTQNSKKVRKTISIDEQVYNTLQKMRDNLGDKLGGRVTYNMVIQSLIHEHMDLQNVRSELENIRKETEDTSNYLKEMLKLALTTPKTPVQITQFPSASMTPPPPPINSLQPPSNSGPPKKRNLNYKAPNTGNMKKDYINEIKQVFNGTIVKPSELLKITKPKHMNSEIKEIQEDTIIPDIFESSTAKHFTRRLEGEADV